MTSTKLKNNRGFTEEESKVDINEEWHDDTINSTDALGTKNLIYHLYEHYPAYAEAEEAFNDIRRQWLETRPVGNRTPRTYHEQSTIKKQSRELCDICLYNIAVIEGYISLSYIKLTVGDRLLPLHTELMSIKDSIVFIDILIDGLTDTQYQEYEEINMEQLIDLSNRIFVIVNDYQDTVIVPALNLTRVGGKIILDIPRFETIEDKPIPDKGNNVLILSVTSHGRHSKVNEYPTFLAIPDNIQLCKTTMTLPGNNAFSLDEHRGFLYNIYGDPEDGLYMDSIIQTFLHKDFTNSFNIINEFMRYRILLEINSFHDCSNLETSHTKNKIEFRKWCDGVLNSTYSLMFNTRFGKYIKNKRYSVNKTESSDITEYGISVYYDSSGLFETGHQLIDVEATFSGSIEMANITLQEIFNELTQLGVWNKIGIIDSSCDIGNECLTHACRNFEMLPLTIRGGRRLRRKRKYTKKRKHTKN